MKKLIWLLLIGAAVAQAPGPDAHSGRFMAANYGQWQDQIISVPSAGQICLQNQQEVAADGSKFYPWNTNASLLVGAGATQETVSPTLFNFTQVPGGVCISATFTKTHVAGDQVSSGTFGLQEALNIAGNNGGGAVTVDIRWVNLGGTTAIKNAASVPSNTGIEDIRTGAGGGGGGSGTVSANNGSAGAVANYAAAGGSTTVGPTSGLTYVTPTLTGTDNGIGNTSTDGVLQTNTTAATASSVQTNTGSQFSPAMHFVGQGWKTNATAGSQQAEILLDNEPTVQAANPTANLMIKGVVNGTTQNIAYFTYATTNIVAGSVGTGLFGLDGASFNGYGNSLGISGIGSVGASNAFGTYINGNNIASWNTTGYSLGSATPLNWTSGAAPGSGGAKDTGLSRLAAGTTAFGTGASGSTAGSAVANAGFGVSLVSTAAITGPVPVKADTSNANQVVVTTTTDTGSGVPIGVCINSPGAGSSCTVIVTGVQALTLGTGTCAIGNFVIVDTTTNGRVKCTGTYTAGTVIGVAMAAQVTVGNTFNVMIGLR